MRDRRTTKEGKPYFHVTYPKYKFGDETVRQVPVQPTYGTWFFNPKTKSLKQNNTDVLTY